MFLGVFFYYVINNFVFYYNFKNIIINIKIIWNGRDKGEKKVNLYLKKVFYLIIFLNIRDINNRDC